MEKKSIENARICVSNVNYHIVWSVKYRNEVMPDHIHIFASAHPKTAPSYIVKMLKEIRARLLFMRYPELKR